MTFSRGCGRLCTVNNATFPCSVMFLSSTGACYCEPLTWPQRGHRSYHHWGGIKCSSFPPGPLLVPSRWLPAQSSYTPAVSRCCRPLHVSSAASLSGSRTEPQRSSSSTGDRRAREEQEEEEGAEDPEYIPRRKAKNPMMKIGYAWMIGLPTGIITFILAKREVDKSRLKQLKVRQRMKNSNEGDYEGSRYRRHTEGVSVDQ